MDIEEVRSKKDEYDILEEEHIGLYNATEALIDEIFSLEADIEVLYDEYDCLSDEGEDFYKKMNIQFEINDLKSEVKGLSMDVDYTKNEMFAIEERLSILSKQIDY